MIDSLQLKNILDSLSFEMTMETDSLGLAISQPIVEAMGKTNWWMWGITALNIAVLGYFSWRLWKTSKQQGEIQNKIQQNAIRIQMHEKYFAIYCALIKDVENSQHSVAYLVRVLNNTVNKSDIRILEDCNPQIKEILPLAEQLLPESEYEQLNIVYHNIMRQAVNLSEVCDMIFEMSDDRKKVLKAIFISQTKMFDFDALFTELKRESAETNIYEYYMNMYLNSVCENERILVGKKFTEKIRKYSDLSDILK